MKFWAAEVKSGEKFDVKLREGGALQLKQACIGEIDGKMMESAYLHIHTQGEHLIIGTINPKLLPSLRFELMFGKRFQISHSLTKGSVYFIGVESYPGEEEEAFLRKKGVYPIEDSTCTSPTLRECMDAVTCFPDFEEGSLRYVEAVSVFVDSSAREIFMSLKTKATRMKFLEVLIKVGGRYFKEASPSTSGESRV